MVKFCDIHGNDLSKIEYNGVQVPIVQDALDVVNLLTNDKMSIARYEFGHSMTPIFYSGEFAILTPIESLEEVNIGDAVFCKVDGHYMTHMVLVKNNETNQCLIGSTHYDIFGWTDEIYAKAHRADKRTFFKEENN